MAHELTPNDPEGEDPFAIEPASPSRRSARSPCSVTPTARDSCLTSGEGLKPMMRRVAVGHRARTAGQTWPKNHCRAWTFGPKSSRPQKTAEFACSSTGLAP